MPNIRNKFTRVEWVNFKEVRAQLRDLVSHLEGETRIGALRAVNEYLGTAAVYLRDEIRKREASQRWPQRLQAATFAYSDVKGRSKKKLTALVGVRTGAPTRRGRGEVISKSNPRGIFAEWHGKAQGRTIGMSLAAMYERGTVKMAKRPAIRPAAQQSGSEALRILSEGFRQIIKDFQK